jgi:hypothetical protein
MSDSPILEGGCLCGAVRYRAEGRPYHITHCHCTLCRRASGAPFVTWFSVPAQGFSFVQGTPSRFASTPAALRTFCAACGTPLTFQLLAERDEIDVTLCSLDDPNVLIPEDHTYIRSRLRCIVLADGLPQFATTRDQAGDPRRPGG